MTDRLSPGGFDTFIMDADGSHQKAAHRGRLGTELGTATLSMHYQSFSRAD
jgi:hypothetical protein